MNLDGATARQLADLARKYQDMAARYEELADQYRQVVEDTAVQHLRVDLLEVGFEVADERLRSGLCPRCAAEVTR